MEFATYDDLLALHRIILTAKFSEIPLDLSVDSSPITASYSQKVIHEIIDVLTAAGRVREANDWVEWLVFAPHLREREIIEQKLKRLSGNYGGRPDAEKRELVENLVAPFQAEEDEIEQLMSYL